MSKFTTTLKGLMALALGSFSLGAYALDLPEHFLTTDESKPNYFFIKNETRGRYVDASNFPSIKGIESITGTDTQYVPAGALWYFVADGEAGNQSCGDQTTRYMTPVKIKNLIQPGKEFDKFGNTPFAETGTTYYVYEATENGTTGFAIMKRNNDGVLRPANTSDSWHMDAQYKCVFWSVSGSNGSLFTFEEAAENKVEGTLENYIVAAKTQLTNTVRLFESIAGSTSLTPEIEKLTTLEEIREMNERVWDNIGRRLDRKVVYMTSNGREAAGKGKYIYLDKTTQKFVATDHKCVLGKWQLIRNGNGNNFVLRNVATDTYISPANTFMASSATYYRTNNYSFEFCSHKDGKGFVLKFTGNNSCQNIGNDDGSYLRCDSQADPSNVTGPAYSFSFEPANIDADNINGNELYVIRSTRGKSDEDSYKFTAKYPGSLITAYTADRELARKRVGYPNGAHLEMYGPGSVWKFVQSGDGYKIYSLIGAQTENTENKGLKVVNDRLEVAANPDVFFLKEITDSNDPFIIPHRYALCTAKDGGKYVTVSDINENGDFFLTLSTTKPTTATDDAASFFIESIGKIHTESEPKGANPEKEYIDYAANLHMFKSIAPVLDDKDMEYILAEKKNANDEPYDYTKIGSIAEANEFMALGDMTASSRAFQRLDGKMVRLENRMTVALNNPRYLYTKTDEGNVLRLINNLSGQELSSVWVIELPGDTEKAKITSARMRQIKLRNLKTNTYVTADLTTGDNAQTLTVRRRPSLDGTEFFLALTKDYERNTALMMRDDGGDNTTPPITTVTAWGANSSTYAHWSIKQAQHTAAPTVKLEKHAAKIDTYVLTVAKPEGVTAMALTGLAHVGKATVAEATAGRALNEATEVELTADTEGNISGEIAANLASTEADKDYTVTLPAALFTLDSNVSPAVNANVTVPKDTSTGIKEIGVSEKGAEVIYDLQGRRVSKASKGVYIINGVKTLVK